MRAYHVAYRMIPAVTLLLSPTVLRSHAQVPMRSPVDSAAMDCAAVRAMTDHASMNHEAHQAALQRCAKPAAATLTMPGQAAFGAIAEAVRLLEADPTTDWSKVNIEALRQHLIDMDDVTMHARFVQQSVPGGIEVDVTGTGPTVSAIRRMVANQSRMLDMSDEYSATSREVPQGAHVTIAARTPADAREVAKIRGLGFAGLMTEGDHHVRHHLAIARGESDPHRH